MHCHFNTTSLQKKRHQDEGHPNIHRVVEGAGTRAQLSRVPRAGARGRIRQVWASIGQQPGDLLKGKVNNEEAV